MAERDWDRFHTPKNLAVSLAIEAGELLEVFQWLSDDESARIRDSAEDMTLIRAEIADVLIYLLRLSDLLEVDLGEAIDAKLDENAKKYPARLSRGNATKYSRRPSSDGDEGQDTPPSSGGT